MMNYFIPPWANAHGVSFFMKEGVPEMSIANVGGGSCEEFWATGVFIVIYLVLLLFLNLKI